MMKTLCARSLAEYYREKNIISLKLEMAGIDLVNGVTGSIHFDKFGNLEEPPVMMEILNGEPELIE